MHIVFSARITVSVVCVTNTCSLIVYEFVIHRILRFLFVILNEQHVLKFLTVYALNSVILVETAGTSPEVTVIQSKFLFLINLTSHSKFVEG